MTLYSRGLSFRAVGELLGTTAQSVLRCGYVDTVCHTPGQAAVVELDEMWHYVGSKDTKLWIWKTGLPGA